jgi:hypothetical protein
MREPKVDSQYCSPFADLMAQSIQEGRSCGYRYETETRHLRQLDRFLCDVGLTSLELPKSVVESWTGKRPNDRPVPTRRESALSAGSASFYAERGGMPMCQKHG